VLGIETPLGQGILAVLVHEFIHGEPLCAAKHPFILQRVGTSNRRVDGDGSYDKGETFEKRPVHYTSKVVPL
jgi:hypothetical protein